MGSNGDAPLRIGPIHITVYVQTRNVIYNLQTDTFLLGDGLVGSVVGSVIVPPLSNSVTFNMQDDLKRLSRYTLYLIAKESGLGVSWNKTIAPPVTRVHVINTLDSTPIQDYQLESSQFQAVAKVGSDTFVIPQDPNAMADLNLSVGGFVLLPNEFSPGSAKFQPMSSFEISTQVVDAQLQVRDALGNVATLGTMKLTRVQGQVQSETVVRSWNASNGVLSLALPPGQYGAEVAVDGSSITTQFSISHESENVTLALPPFALSESRSQLIMVATVLVLIMIEAVFAFRLWRKLARTRNKKPARKSPLSL